jgi:hypothetical protein
MRKSLEQAPKGLSEMLRHVLESFSASSNEEELEYLNELLAWTTCAPRPLKLDEIETILRLCSPDGEGMIYPEGALRKQFASFFSLNREDGLTTAELQNPRQPKIDLDDEDEESDDGEDNEDGEAFQDVENDTDFDSNKETTEVTFCHASIGDFFRNESQGKVSAGEGHVAIGVDYHDAKVYILKTCLRIICELGFPDKIEGGLKFLKDYASEFWLQHVETIELSKVKLEDKREIASMLSRVFSREDVIRAWWPWNSSFVKYKWILQWWEDKELVESLPKEEQDFITSTAGSPATLFKPVAQVYGKLLFDPQNSDAGYYAGIINVYLQLANGKMLDASSDSWTPTAGLQQPRILAMRLNGVVTRKQQLGIDASGWLFVIMSITRKHWSIS